MPVDAKLVALAQRAAEAEGLEPSAGMRGGGAGVRVESVGHAV